MKRIIAGLLGCVAVVIGGGVGAHQDGDAEQFGPWSEPVNLGAVVNSSLRDTGGSISKDGLSLYFSSSRAGTTGTDLYVSRRLAIDLPWMTPAPLDMLNSPVGDDGPSLSDDNRYLFFASGRAGAGLDLWVSQRRHKQDDFGWEAPGILPSPPNSLGLDVAPRFVESPGRRQQLYFSSGPNPAGLDIYVTELRKNGTWTEPGESRRAQQRVRRQRIGDPVRRVGDDLLVQARRQPGSVRDAAGALVGTLDAA